VDSETCRPIALNSRLALSYRDASEKKIDTGAAESTGAHRAMTARGVTLRDSGMDIRLNPWPSFRTLTANLIF
jgi:hypothetical protein